MAINTNTVRRSVLKGLAFFPFAAAPAFAANTATDPALVAIDAFAQADADYRAVYRGEVKVTPEENAAFLRRCDCESAALRTVPTTPDGALALAQFAEQRTRDGLMDDDELAFAQTMFAYFVRARAAA